MFKVDLTNVKEQLGFEPIPQGEYVVMAEEAQVKSTKSGGGEYIHVKFTVLSGAYEGRKLFEMFNIKNENVKAVEIGLSKLKSFLVCAGVQNMVLDDVAKLEGKTVIAVVKNKTDSYGEKNTIQAFKKPSLDSLVSTATKNSEIPF
jgi:hypothetical protein